MKAFKTTLATLATVGLFAVGILTTTESHAQNIFDYQFLQVFATNALTYDVQYSNMQQMTESGNQTNGTMYFCPASTGVSGYITKKFVFATPTTNVFLSAKISIFNFGSGEYGSGSLSGSTNGTSWTLLMNCPTSSTNGFDYLYSTNIPQSLCGSTNFYIQAQLLANGFNNMAQFSRADIVGQTNANNGGVTNIFEIKATLMMPPPPPSLGIASYNQAPVVFYPTASSTNVLTGSNYVLQMATNLSSPTWVTVTNGVSFIGIQITNPPSNAFFRLH